ncbi:MerR family transcriptional regulator [Paenibacillus albiflavus]|uniref:MerR family transcriptional regulator n=1 Tax=Paenibacillus albiflavus TaxID=2545760 RepID=A0A4R4EN83_9BACL|nr:MerR family transcriptional regulator [Paenibacillus albiflavus]TCZ81053.1 MerR family transcriptional regulator [Paenibacillus albiflavus]
MSDEFRKNMALFPIGIVMKLTDLTARQIRYYEQNELVFPARTSGNQRLYSFNDVTSLLRIKELLEKGVNIAGIKQMIGPNANAHEDATVLDDQSEVKRKELTDLQLHSLLKQQLLVAKRPGQVSLIQGELSRFYSN